MKGLLADREHDVVAVGGHQLDLRDIDHVQHAAGLSQQARPLLKARLR